jgi:putative nucleotidyltransferase with HDIG domain
MGIKKTATLTKKRHHVASGDYFTGKKQPIIAQAFLGTCVGIAVFDADNGIGGLIHILLPEPPSYESVPEPRKYASTGLPLFIKELYEKGADPKKMKAWIAGGALMGPVTRHDIALDTGGRSAEISKSILAKEGIHIEYAETGGGFATTLNLDMQDWKVNINPSGFEKSVSKENIHTPSQKEIENSISQILPIPQVALSVLRMINEEASDFKMIASEIRKDQVISAKALQLCNSAFFSGKRKIDSLDDVLIILGSDLIVRSVIQVAIEGYFGQSGFGYALCKGGLYLHSVGVAIISEKLAETTGKSHPGVAYTAGLLHDIGMVALDRYVASSYPFFYRSMQVKGRDILETEREIFKTDHTEIGTRLARMWSLPETLTEVISCHHTPEKAVLSPELSHIVYLAVFLMSRFHSGYQNERIDTENFEERLGKIGLSVSSLTDIVEFIPTGVLQTV